MPFFLDPTAEILGQNPGRVSTASIRVPMRGPNKNSHDFEKLVKLWIERAREKLRRLGRFIKPSHKLHTKRLPDVVAP